MLDNIQFTVPQAIVLWGIPLLFAITVHEVAHGWVANKLGDPTARILGRLTLNPLKHIDLFGTIILPALTIWLGGIIFGWAKPVPITWRNLRHKRRDIALVAFAGPFANFLMVFIWAAVAKLGITLEAHHITQGVVFEAMGKIGIYVNALLMILNLLPIQPLDGGRVVSSLLPGRWSYYFDKLEPYGLIILLVLIMFGVLGMLLTGPVETFVTVIKHVYGI
ncbi:MAG TPA: site-2 protease family protein [Gammaproteobacteria bacterium]|nr:site-2 protease family protein [Gammaproteobacteria bacterium]